MIHSITVWADIGTDDLVEVDVSYDYQPAERMTWDYPGCPESVDLCSVVLGGTDILGDMTPEQQEYVQQAVLDALEEEAKNDAYGD